MEQQEKQKRVTRAKNGERTQKLMAFRIDLGNWEWLQGISNKGRLINDLIKRRREEERRWRTPRPEIEDEDEQPDSRLDYQP